MELYEKWLEAKRIETEAVETRRQIEDEIVAAENISESFEGTLNMNPNGYRVKIVGRITRKVDASMIQDLAHEHGLEQYLSTLIRWKPEVNLSVWKHADARVTAILSTAITAQPGRPSFQITKE
jgi:hypothetical protein